jgi:hypothetical protein
MSEKVDVDALIRNLIEAVRPISKPSQQLPDSAHSWNSPYQTALREAAKPIVATIPPGQIATVWRALAVDTGGLITDLMGDATNAGCSAIEHQAMLTPARSIEEVADRLNLFATLLRESCFPDAVRNSGDCLRSIAEDLARLTGAYLAPELEPLPGPDDIEDVGDTRVH